MPRIYNQFLKVGPANSIAKMRNASMRERSEIENARKGVETDNLEVAHELAATSEAIAQIYSETAQQMSTPQQMNTAVPNDDSWSQRVSMLRLHDADQSVQKHALDVFKDVQISKDTVEQEKYRSITAVNRRREREAELALARLRQNNRPPQPLLQPIDLRLSSTSAVARPPSAGAATPPAVARPPPAVATIPAVSRPPSAVATTPAVSRPPPAVATIPAVARPPVTEGVPPLPRTRPTKPNVYAADEAIMTWVNEAFGARLLRDYVSQMEMKDQVVKDHPEWRNSKKRLQTIMDKLHKDGLLVRWKKDDRFVYYKFDETVELHDEMELEEDVNFE